MLQALRARKDDRKSRLDRQLKTHFVTVWSINLYRQTFPHPGQEIEREMEAIELDYLIEDLPKTIDSMKEGTLPHYGDRQVHAGFLSWRYGDKDTF